jgi:phospholipid/cholesterol/gamma-HCH transport system substrate-binding protein
MHEFASEDASVAAAVGELPGALSQTTDTMTRLERYATLLGPTAEHLRPAARALAPANDAVRPLAKEATPLLANDIRPFVREARPLIRDLRPAAEDLAHAEPGLTRTFTVLNRFFNMVAYNKGGREGPDKADRDEGYLFYIGWLTHQVNNLFGNVDAHGPGRPITTGGTCAVLENTVQANEELEALLGLTGVLTDPALCGGKSSTDGGNGLLPSARDLPSTRKGGR